MYPKALHQSEMLVDVNMQEVLYVKEIKYIYK